MMIYIFVLELEEPTEEIFHLNNMIIKRDKCVVKQKYYNIKNNQLPLSEKNTYKNSVTSKSRFSQATLKNDKRHTKYRILSNTEGSL